MPAGSFMIPFGSTMGSTLNTFNSYGQQFLKNRLDQQQMTINQQREQMEQQRLQMEKQQQDFAQQQEMYNRQKQEAGQGAAAQMFSRFGSLLQKPEQRMAADAMANAAAAGVPPDQIEKIAAGFGLTEESKAMLNWYKDYYYYGRGLQAEETGKFVGSINPAGGGSAGSPGAPGAPTGYSGGAGPPPPSSAYGSSGGGMGGGGMPPPPNPFGAGTPPPPGGGGSPGGLPPGWSVVGTTKNPKYVGKGWMVDPRDGRSYYVDPYGNVTAPGPIMAGGMGGGGMGGPPGGGMPPPAPGSATRPVPLNPLGTY